MKTNGFYSIGQRGFTLVEIIITLVLSAILGTILVQLGGTALTKSSSTVLNAMYEVNVQRVMEGIVADYSAKKSSEGADAALIHIEDSIRDGYYDEEDTEVEEPPKDVNLIDSDGQSVTVVMVTVSSGGHTLSTLF